MNPISVLIVDDSTHFREELRMALAQEAAISVVGTVDGRQAADMAEAVRPDILLLTANKPGRMALDMLSMIRQRLPDTRVLILSEEADEEFIDNALQLGAKGCVAITANHKDLVKAIQTIDAGEVWVGRKLLAGVLDRLRRKTQELDHPFPETRGTLTSREQEVVGWVIQGLTNKQIAARLGISDKTVKSHISNIFSKLKINRRLQLALHGFLEQAD
ncbi:MAG: hypothetical protein C3F08_10340 [Candidatus Methylomirabilota bacterium]|nr:MAG: hypothetical protein C3F08_10340 [candidate division NC10 bacterium]